MSDELLKSLEGWESPYLGRISLESRPGDQVDPEDPNRNQILIIDDNTIITIKSMYHQVLKVHERSSGKAAYLRRTVGRLEDGKEIDLAEPMALDADLVETGIDTSKCAACGLRIDALDLQFHEGKAYHSYCLVEVE
jgi:hypothetical protein